MNYILIRRILKRCLEDKNSNLTEFAKNEFGITYDACLKKFQRKTRFYFEEVDKIVKYCNGQIKYEDFCQDPTSTNENNTNNDKVIVKNSTSEDVRPVPKADDVG